MITLKSFYDVDVRFIILIYRLGLLGFEKRLKILSVTGFFQFWGGGCILTEKERRLSL